MTWLKLKILSARAPFSNGVSREVFDVPSDLTVIVKRSSDNISKSEHCSNQSSRSPFTIRPSPFALVSRNQWRQSLHAIPPQASKRIENGLSTTHRHAGRQDGRPPISSTSLRGNAAIHARCRGVTSRAACAYQIRAFVEAAAAIRTFPRQGFPRNYRRSPRCRSPSQDPPLPRHPHSKPPHHRCRRCSRERALARSFH